MEATQIQLRADLSATTQSQLDRGDAEEKVEKTEEHRQPETKQIAEKNDKTEANAQKQREETEKTVKERAEKNAEKKDEKKTIVEKKAAGTK